MAELSVRARPHVTRKATSWSIFVLLSVSIVATIFGGAFSSNERPAGATALSLTFENTTAGLVTLGSLASRSQCGLMSKQGVGPYTMTGTDSLTGQQYSYVTNSNYGGAQLRESKEAPSSMSFGRNTTSYGGKSNVVQLTSSGSVTWNNSCNGATVYGSAFGPQVWTQAFQATAGQALSFNWAAAGGGDDYEVYAFLVRVAHSNDYGSNATTTLIAHGRGTTQAWTTSTGSIPTDGFYRFRFVNGSYDASGGKVLGASMYIDPNVLVGDANNITFGTLSDRVTSSSSQTFTVSATTTSGGTVNFTSTTTGRCTVGASTLANGTSTATVTLLANQTGLCTISADSAATGNFATAATVTRSFTILAAPTAPTNSGGTTVSGTAAVGQTLTAVDGSWADGGSPITATLYQWESCLASSCSWATVAGATDSSILLGSSDVGRQFRVKVTKTNGIGSTTVNSTASSTVAKGNQATLTISTTVATFGEPLTLATVGGSGSGAVTFAKVSGTCTVSGGVLTPGDVGSSCVVTATKAADVAYNAATSANASITVQQATQAVLTINPTSGTFGATVSLATSGGSGTGSVSYTVVSGPCTVSGSTLTPTGAGTCVVRATKAADTNYQSRVSADATVAIARSAQTAAVQVTSSSATYGDPETLSASGGNGTGAFSFTKVSGPCTVSGSTMTPTGVGTCVVNATRAADTDYLAATSSNASITIARRQLTFTVSALDRDYDGTNDAQITVGTLSNKVSGDDVEVDSSKITGTFANGEPGTNKLVTLAFASGVLRGADAGNYTYATPANPRADITRANQTSFALTSPSTFVVGTPLQLQSAGGQSGGSVSYSVTSGVCTVSGTQLSATRGGITCVVTATRQGDTRYVNATATQTITVNKAPQQLTFRSTAPSPSLVGGTYTVSVTSDAFLAPTVVIANSSASVCSIAADVVTFNAAGTCLISASQSGTDVYLAAAASQSVSVEVAPVPTTIPPSTQAASQAAVAPTATTPRPAVTAPPTTAAPTTTTTTTTVAPNQGDPTQPMTDETGVLPDLDAGVVTAMVRGQKVEVETIVEQNVVRLRLPNEVEVGVAATDSDGNPLPVSADGSVQAFLGGNVRVQMDGLVPGTVYTAYMFSEPTEIGRGTVGPDGRVDVLLEIPKELEQGGHTLQVNGVGPDSEVVSLSLGVEVFEREDNTVLTTTVIVLAILGAMFIPLQRRRRLVKTR